MNKYEVLPKVKKIMNNATKEAKIFDDVNVKPAHILLSILADNDNECVNALKTMGVDIPELYDLVADQVRKTDMTPRVGNVGRRTLPFSKESDSLLRSTDAECEKLNDNAIDVPHVMLALLFSKNPITFFLMTRGINYDSFKKAVKEMRNDFSKGSFEGDEQEESFGDSFKKKQKSGEPKSKTPVLDNFCRDISKAVERGETDPVVGRKDEIKRVSQILSRRKKNNPVLIGEPGVGKTAIVEGLAQLIYEGDAPRTLIGKRIYSLDLASIVAGTKYRGQFEERMKAVLEECKANPDIVLFIDELHTIIGAGNASGSLDASNIFKPALARGELQVIGATTLDEYRENIEKDGALTRRFQQVLVEEPSLDETIVMLHNIKDKYEKHHRVKYTDEAIEECAKLAARYIMDRAMPDKAIDILDEAGASTNVGVEKPDYIRELEAKKNEINERKKEVVLKQKYEEAAKLRDEEKKVKEDLEASMKEWTNKLDKKITTVDVDIIAEVVSIATKIPLTKISTQESKRLMNMDKDLSGKVIGQDDAVLKVVKAIKRNRVGIKDKNKPVGSFIFLGPTGVGKCYVADTEIIIKDKRDNSIKKITIEELKKILVSNTN